MGSLKARVERHEKKEDSILFYRREADRLSAELRQSRNEVASLQSENRKLQVSATYAPPITHALNAHPNPIPVCHVQLVRPGKHRVNRITDIYVG